VDAARSFTAAVMQALGVGHTTAYPLTMPLHGYTTDATRTSLRANNLHYTPHTASRPKTRMTATTRRPLPPQAAILSLLLALLVLLPLHTVHGFSAWMHKQVIMSSSSNRPKAAGGTPSSSSAGPSPSPRLRSSSPSSFPSQKKTPPPPSRSPSPPGKKLRPPVPLPDQDQIYARSFLPPKLKPTTLIISDKKRGLWVFEQPFVLGVVDVKNRMSVLRLSDGGFAIYSPLAATPECISMLQKLIKDEKLSLKSAWFLVPSSFPEHHESLITWREVLPEARVVSVHPKINVIAEYLFEGSKAGGAEGQLPVELREDLEVGVLQTLLLRELIVCHKPSGTLFVSDSGFYINEEYSNSLTKGITKLQGIYDRFVTPPFFRLGTDRKEGRALYGKIKGWGFEKIVTCHAALVPEGEGGREGREMKYEQF